MERKKCKLMPKIMAIVLLITALASNITYSQAATDEKGSLKTYIVFVEKPGDAASSQSEDLDSWYKSFLPVKTASSSLKKGLVFSYRNVFIGFAAKLTPEEVSAMAGKEGFVSAHPERILSVQTTETPSFLGLHQNTGFWNQSSYGKGMIIGLMDTGILHDHPSFSDEQMSPPPAKWKGTCDFNVTVCNNKLIGAKNLLSPGEVPTDDYMHGTHTAGTAAGSPVPGANFFGQANGTAIGMAPLAHLAMYKVCNGNGRCPESAVLAAMDSAIEDGVDVMSLSLGYGTLPFFNDTIALGAYRAIQKGIFVSCSAGNSGPDNSSLSNEAPWILTVGASTVDRAIRATVLLGNNKELDGQSLLQPNFTSALFPLVNAGANGNASSAACAPGSLKNTDVKGKIVLCERGMVAGTQKAQEVNNSGGVAMILMNSAFYGYVTFPVSYMIPSTLVSYAAGEAIRAYINSTSSPMATILFKGTVTGLPEAPQVAEFSSRGPSVASPGILKPDVIGPGVEVLAAWPESYDNSSNSLTKFAMISGTSMSCPHLAGIAALLKSTHPDWSPAAIKSAIITTADLLNLGGKPITDDQFVPVDVFTIGGGHVNPSRANDPGLVYDLQPDDFIPYLCGLQYTDREVGLIAQKTVSCSNVSIIPEAQLNYPSFSIRLGASPQTYTRTVTNVGDPISAYALEIEAPEGVDVKVTPASINFSGLNQKATYSVTFSKNGTSSGSFAQGYLNWKDGKRIVRSPIAVLFV